MEKKSVGRGDNNIRAVRRFRRSVSLSLMWIMAATLRMVVVGGV